MAADAESSGTARDKNRMVCSGSGFQPDGLIGGQSSDRNRSRFLEG